MTNVPYGYKRRCLKTNNALFSIKAVDILTGKVMEERIRSSEVGARESGKLIQNAFPKCKVLILTYPNTLELVD